MSEKTPESALEEQSPSINFLDSGSDTSRRAISTMPNDFSVIIVGGSVAGLSLAHCLQRLGVSFIILEQGEIAPQLGASIGILPNGGRILDQLGIFESVEREIEPLEYSRIRYPDDFWFESRYPKALHSNYHYPVSFLERQRFLQILYDTLESKNHVYTGKRVLAVESGDDSAVVKTSDGSTYKADIVVGADGVHSVVRSEIWRHVTKVSQPHATEQENSGIKYEYSCIYGISRDVPHMELGSQLSRLDDGVSIHVFSGKKSKAFWFAIVKTPQDISVDNASSSDCAARKICDSMRPKRVSDALTFDDIWSRCTIFKMTPLEEGVFKQWHYGRLLCIGDAVRKMCPNIGQGANLAIEDAARLANLMYKRLPLGKLSAGEVNMMLQEFTATQKPRTNSICAQSEFLVRMHANQGIGRRLLGRYIIPFLNDAPAGLSGLSISNAAKIDFIDTPTRSLGGAWDASWGSILRILSCLRPKLGVHHSVYLLAFAIATYYLCRAAEYACS
ncbi:FAD dependent monooxygenase [Metarhizium album ARSEF 1941]|uniref:FAD dependent monooxygenase n=1 Tax=Metarhizium album (strain ARSEF 1941) TaxID=1081103 RepID=A0A0B2WJX0_METAS|nr:FAD dependent monooxygenase [Metarhizium album ARSEF 1941]KHN94004.1 FAD dependent monooxygenase [Metarhizium album ARSEF 1941]